MKINVNLDSIYDEGFIFLKQQVIGINSVDKGSLFPVIINSLFGKEITSSLLYLRYVRFFVHFLSVILFAFLSSWYLFKKGILDSFERKVLFPSLLFLMGNLALGGIVISYNTLQEFFLLVVIGCFLVTNVTSSRNSIFLFILIGFFSFFSIMTILPSGLLVLACVISLIWIKNCREWKTGLIFTLSLLSGLFLSLLFFQFFIFDLRTVYSGMTKTAVSITTLDRGYDPLSFLIKIILYFRDFFIATCLLLGISLIAMLIRKYSNRWVAALIFLVSMLTISIYQKKPEIVFTNFLAFPIIILFIVILFETPKFNRQKLFSYKILYHLFLFFLPLISSIGTNVYLGTKMICFILPWGVLLMEIMCNDVIKNKYAKEIRFLIFFFILLNVIQPIQSMVHDAKNREYEKLYFNKEKPISQIQLSAHQKEYFEKVYKIMKRYGYKRKDLIFSTQLDQMTIVAFDGTPCGLYFQPMDYMADVNKFFLPKPDFIFLTEFDLSLINNSLHLQKWSFPHGYDRFFVGSPQEKTETTYSTDRWLYCAKNKIISTMR